MTTRMSDLQDKRARIDAEIENEKEVQRIDRALKAVAKKVAATLSAETKDAGLDLDQLDGKTFHCRMDRASGHIKMELITTTEHGKAHVAILTVNGRN